MSGTVIALSLIILALLWDRRSERNEWAAERADLLQRIQAPEIAVVEHQQRQIVEQSPVLPWDDDEAFHHTREDLAEALKHT